MSEKQIEKEPNNIPTIQGVVCSDPGNPIAPIYKRVYVDKFNKNLVLRSGSTNLQEFIDASRSMTDLASLEKRLIATGEIPNVNPNLNGDGIDFTKYPTNIHEVYSMYKDVDNSFNKLPESVQKVFGSKDVFLKAVLDGSYQSKIVSAFNSVNKVPSDTVKEEVKNNE